MERPLGLLIADEQQPDIDVSWLTIPGGEEEPADALYHRTTVILFNIEHLSDTNDTHGRQVGDQLLRCVAERLRRRFGDNLAYFGGGVFAAVFDVPRQRREAAHDSATAVFGQPFALRGRPIPATVRCALARYPVDGQGPEALLHCAERALDKIREHHQKPSGAVPSANEEILHTVVCEDSEEERSHPARVGRRT